MNANFEAEVKNAMKIVRSKLERFGSGNLSVNTGGSYHWVSNDVADEVIRRFKSEGYYAQRYYNIKDVAVNICITKEPTTRDI